MNLRATSDERRATKWWRAVRPFAYPASLVPAALGITVAWVGGAGINFALALATVLGAVLAHTGANLLNDYVDFMRGVDRPGSHGGSGVLVEGLLTPRAILFAAVVSFALAGFIAIPLCIIVGWPLVALVVAGFIAGAGYVLPPFGFKYRALGDVIVFFTFGIGITLGAFVVQTGHFSWAPVLYAIPIALLTSAILHVNNMRDMGNDIKTNVKTLANLMGPKASARFYALLVSGAFALLILFVVAGFIAPLCLAVLVTLPLFVRLVLHISRASSRGGSHLVLADAQTAQLNLVFGALLIAGLVLSKFIDLLV